MTYKLTGLILLNRGDFIKTLKNKQDHPIPKVRNNGHMLQCNRNYEMRFNEMRFNVT
jgi:hypothetical protein